MVKIFNLEMAIHFLERDKSHNLFTCGLYQDNDREITHKDIDELRKLKNDNKNSWMYQYYTQDLAGKKWNKYAELDVFTVEKDMFGKYPGWDSESEFLYLGYSSVICGLQEKIRNLEAQIKREQEVSQRYFKENTEYVGMILNMADDFELDCPSEIKEKLVAEFDKCDDDYKSDFHILPNIAAAEHVAKELDKWAFIAERTDVIDGWYAVWSIGD